MKSMLVPRSEMNEIYFDVELDGKLLTKEQKKSVTMVEFDESDTEADLVRVTIADSARAFVNRTDALEKGVSLKLMMGYTKHHPTLFDGFVSYAEAEFDAYGVPFITIGAIDKSKSMSSTLKTREFKNIKISDIAKSVGESYGYRVIVTDTEEVHESIQQDAESDAQLLSRLADNEAFVWYLSESDKVMFFGKRLPENLSIDGTFNYGKGNYGVISFNPVRVEKNKEVKTSSSSVDATTGEETSFENTPTINTSPQIPDFESVITIDGRDGSVSSSSSKVYSSSRDVSN